MNRFVGMLPCSKKVIGFLKLTTTFPEGSLTNSLNKHIRPTIFPKKRQNKKTELFLPPKWTGNIVALEDFAKE
tara:strand:+ start:344 stop:562 length:219 start_codon:yes stop_codon:yes gene_type:complete